MPAQIRYKSFRITGPAGQIPHDFDLTGDLQINADAFAALQPTLLKFQNLPPATEITLELDGREIKLQRAAGADKIIVTPPEAGNVYEYLTQQFAIDNIAELQELLFVVPDSANTFEILSRLQQISVPDPKVAVIQGKIDELDGKISKQREVDNASLQIGELQSSLDGLKQDMQIVQELVQKRNQLALKLQQLQSTNPVGSKDTQTQWLKQITELREQELHKLQNIKSEVAKLENDQKPPKFGIPLLTLGAVLLLGGLGSALWSGNIWPALIGLLGIVIEVMVFFIINTVPPKFDLQTHIQSKAKANISLDQDVNTKQINSLERMFIHTAWLNVLKHEVDMMGTTIKGHLNGEDLDTINNEQHAVEDRIKKLQQTVESYKGQDISPEEYLKLRRELDMLKIEKAKLEGFPKDDVESSDALQKVLGELGLVAEGSKAKVVEGKLMISQNGTESALGIPAETTAVLAVLAALEYWKSISGIWPLVLVDVLTKLPADWQQKLGGRINEYRNSGQILTVQVSSQA